MRSVQWVVPLVSPLPLQVTTPTHMTPLVTPSSTVLLEVELISFIDNKSAEEYSEMSEEGKSKMTFDEILEVARAEKEVCYYIAAICMILLWFGLVFRMFSCHISYLCFTASCRLVMMLLKLNNTEKLLVIIQRYVVM